MGCLIRSIFTALLVVVIGTLAFLNRDRIRSAWQDVRGIEAPSGPSVELADAAEAKLDALENGDVDKIAFSEVELQSLVTYRYRELLPAFVDSPRVELDGSRIGFKGRVPVDRLPDIGGIGDAATFLPDTTEVEVVGELLPLSGRRAALAVDQVKAARIPLPQRLVPAALSRLGRKDENGLPKDAIAIPLPLGADAAYVRNDSLIFMTNRRD